MKVGMRGQRNKEKKGHGRANKKEKEGEIDITYKKRFLIKRWRIFFVLLLYSWISYFFFNRKKEKTKPKNKQKEG